MTLFTRSRPKVVKRTHALGSARGVRYHEVDGAEYVEAGMVATEDEARERAVLLEVRDEIHDEHGKSMTVGVRFRQLLPVQSGTFARERSKAYRPRTEPRYVDALDLPVLAARQPRIFGGGSGSGPVSIAGSGSYAGGRPAIRGRDLVGFLESRGVSLSVHAGRLLVSTAAGHLTLDLREVIERAERMLIGYLSGTPALCELAHKGRPDEAWTVLVGGDILACYEHATGEADSNA